MAIRADMTPQEAQDILDRRAARNQQQNQANQQTAQRNQEQQSPQQNEQGLGLNRVPLGMAIGTGFLSTMAPHKYKEAIRQMPNMLMNMKPDTVQQIETGAGEMGPYGLAMSGVPRLTTSASKLTPRLAEWAGRAGTTGAAWGEGEHKDPVMGAISNIMGEGAGSLLGKSLGFLMNKKPVMNRIGNYVLDKINKSAEAGEALTPEQAAQEYAKYQRANGEALPVDIGTITQHPGTQKFYAGAKEIPFSDAEKNANITTRGMTEKKNLEHAAEYKQRTEQAHQQVAEAQERYKQQVDQADAQQKQYEQSQRDYQTRLEETKNINANREATYAERTKQVAETNAAREQDFSSQQENYEQSQRILQEHKAELESQRAAAEAQHLAAQHTVNRAPEEVNQLLHGIPERTEPGHYLSETVRQVYDPLREEARTLAAPLNDSTLNLNEAHPHFTYPKYREAAMEINRERESLINAFGTDSDLASSVRSEVDKAGNFLKNKASGKETSMNAMVTRIRRLGQLWQAAKEAGNNNAARLLNNVRRALVDDVHALLEQSGNKDLSDAWLKFNTFFRENIVPFWKTSAMRKVVGQEESRATHIAPGQKLSNELYDPNNRDILAKMPAKVKDVAYHQLLTGGKGTSKGETTLSPTQIATQVGSQQAHINKTYAAHNPDKMGYLENLSKAIELEGKLGKQHKAVTDRLGKIKEPTAPKAPKKLPEPKMPMRKAEPKAPTAPKKPNLKEVKEAKKELRIAQDYGKEPQMAAPGEMSAAIRKAITLGKGGSAIGLAVKPKLLPIALGLSRSANVMSKLLTSPELIKAYTSRTKLPEGYDYLSQALRKSGGIMAAGGVKHKKR